MAALTSASLGITPISEIVWEGFGNTRQKSQWLSLLWCGYNLLPCAAAFMFSESLYHHHHHHHRLWIYSPFYLTRLTWMYVGKCFFIGLFTLMAIPNVCNILRSFKIHESIKHAEVPFKNRKHLVRFPHQCHTFTAFSFGLLLLTRLTDEPYALQCFMATSVSSWVIRVSSLGPRFLFFRTCGPR